MADFCKQCSLDHLGIPNYTDLDKLCKDDEYVQVICEGCGQTVVNSKGECIAKNCLDKHDPEGIELVDVE